MSRLYLDKGPSAPLDGEHQGRKIMLATTAYDAPDAAYVSAIASTRQTLEKVGLPSAYLIYTGNCHVDDARNRVVHEFLKSDCSELFFLDADVTWHPVDLVKIALKDRDIVGAVYPFRDPLLRTEMPCRMIYPELPDDGLVEMDGLPTGFMKIHRDVFEKLAPDQDIKPIPGGPSSVADMRVFFERKHFDGIGWLGGDLAFCQKWRRSGGAIWADPEIRLGHTAKIVVYGSLAQAVRLRKGETLSHIVDLIAAGEERATHYDELWEWLGNDFAAPPVVLQELVKAARKAYGPIIETGSGLSTILMAAANPNHYVYCLEHDPVWAAKTLQMARQAAVKNIGFCRQKLGQDGWYDLSDCDLPERFALGFADGPPRAYKSRHKFFDVFGGKCDVILVDDANTDEYRNTIETFADEQRRAVEYKSERLAILGKAEKEAPSGDTAKGIVELEAYTGA